MLAVTPDPAPGGVAHVRIVAYDMILPAVRMYPPGKGRVIPHWFFRCHIPVHGHRHCVLFRR